MNEPRNIAKLSNAVVIGFSQSKLNDWIFSSEILIDNYNTFNCSPNRHGGGIVKSFFFPPKIENIFFELLMDDLL